MTLTFGGKILNFYTFLPLAVALYVHVCKVITLTVLLLDYTIKPIVPAKKGDVVSVAEAMHKEKFGQRVKKLFEPETEAAIHAMQSGLSCCFIPQI